MKAGELISAREKLKSILVEKLKEYVKENGKDVTDYDRNVFGFDDDDSDCTITKVLSFYDNDGCYFPTTNGFLSEFNPFDKTTDQLVNELSEKFSYWAFQCLYIKIEDGEEMLKYYTFYNDGTWFSENLAEPEHEYVDTLPLEVICNIIKVINYGASKG